MSKTQVAGERLTLRSTFWGLGAVSGPRMVFAL